MVTAVTQALASGGGERGSHGVIALLSMALIAVAASRRGFAVTVMTADHRASWSTLLPLFPKSPSAGFLHFACSSSRVGTATD